MIAVSNTSPLIALAKIQHLGILRGLFEQVLVPTVVVHEFTRNATALEKREFQNIQDILHEITDKDVQFDFARKLDQGELAVLGLALRRNIEIVLLDDRKAFNEAKAHGLLPVSTRALLLAAEQRGLVENYHALEQRLREQCFFMPDY